MSTTKGLVTYKPHEYISVFPKSSPSGVMSKKIVPIFQKAVTDITKPPQAVFFKSHFPRNDQENPDPFGDAFFPAQLGGCTFDAGFVPAGTQESLGVIRGSRLRINAGADGYLLGLF